MNEITMEAVAAMLGYPKDNEDKEEGKEAV